MQLQFNNSPLGGGGGIKPWVGETRIFFFFFFAVVVVFGVLGSSPPSRWERRLEKERWLVFHVLLPRLDMHTARAVGCCWGCYWLDATDRMDFVTGSTLHSGCRLCLLVRLTCEVEAPTPPRTTTTTTWGPRSCSNPPQILSGPVNRNNGNIQRADCMQAPQNGQGCHSRLPLVSTGHRPLQLWHT